MTPIGPTRRRVIIALGAATLSSIAPRSMATEEGPPLNMGYQTNLVGLVGMVAEEEKLYVKVGANVKVNRFHSGAAVRDAMIAKRIDIGAVGSTPFIIGVTKGELLGLGVVAYTARMCMIVAGKNSGIKDVAGLRGRKIASQLGSQTDYAFQNKIAPKFGLKKGDYQVVNTKFENQVSALAAGSVDAFAGVDPFVAIAIYEGLGVPLVDYSQFDILPSILAVNRGVYEQRRVAIVAFLRGWLAAVKIIQQQPQRAMAVTSKIFREQGYKLPDPVLQQAISRIDVNPAFVPEMKSYLTEQSQILLNQGLISTVPDWDHALVREPLQEAMKD